MADLPDLLNQLEDVRIESPRPENLLLIVVVARTKTPAPSADVTPVQSQPPNGAAQPSQPSQPPQQGQAQPQFSPVPNSSNGSTFPPYPYGAPTAQQQAPTPQPQAAYPPQVQRILGPFVSAPVVQTMLSVVPDMSEQQLENLRDILQEVPECQTDIQRLSLHLTERARLEGQTQ